MSNSQLPATLPVTLIATPGGPPTPTAGQFAFVVPKDDCSWTVKVEDHSWTVYPDE